MARSISPIFAIVLMMGILLLNSAAKVDAALAASKIVISFAGINP